MLRPGDGLEERLKKLLADLPEDVVRAVEGLGVQTTGDFHHLWASSQACFTELEAKVGRGLTTTEAMKVAVAWTGARRESLRAVESLAARVAQERQSSVSVSSRTVQGDAREVVAPAVAASRAAKVRKLFPTGLPVAAAPLVTQAARADGNARAEAARQHKVDQLFQVALENILNLEELGTTLEKLADPMELQRVKDVAMAGASRLSVQRLGALLSAYRRWQRFCEARQLDARAPSPMAVAEFLKGVAMGGPTAASGMHACLKWFATNLGANFQVEHWATRHFRFHSVNHTGRQAPELEPWEFINLALMMSRAHGTHQVILAQLLMVAMSCIRFEHLQRSKFVAQLGPGLEFFCGQGKSRKQGARPGYKWCMPPLVLAGQSVAQVLYDFYAHELPQDVEFLLPALALEPEDLWEVTEMTPFLTNKAMSRARFLELLRGALCQIGVDFPQAQAATFNRLRRFVPTMANLMELPDLDLQAVGNWCEVPSGGGRDPSSKKPRGATPMGVHYAGSRVSRSLQVKSRCVDRLMHLFNHKKGELAMSEAGLLCRDAWTWPEVAALHQLLPEVPEKEVLDGQQGAIEVAPGALDPVDCPALPTVSAGDGSGTDSSSSASDESADGCDLEGVLADDGAAEDMPWLVQGRKTHLIREETDGRPVPWCRDFAYAQDPSERGRGLTVLSRDSFCQRCLGRMPRGLYLALAEHNRWAH